LSRGLVEVFIAKKNNIEASKSNKSPGQVKKHHKDKSSPQKMDDSMLSFIKAISEADVETVREFFSEISSSSVERSEIDIEFLYAVQDGLIQKVRGGCKSFCVFVKKS
jgi:hypothetical protein